MFEAVRMRTALTGRREAAARALGRKAPWPPSGSWSVGWLLVAGFLLHLALRLAISIGRDGPTIFADETGYLVNARVLAGGVPGQLSMAALYRGGYSLLLVPAHWLGRDPLGEYHGVLVTNALLSSLVFPLVHVLLTRTFRVAPRTALIAAFLAALYPPLVVTTQFASAESLLPALVLAAAISLGAVVAAPRRRVAAGWAIACGCCAGALFTTHGRTAPLLALLVALPVVVAVPRRQVRPAAVTGVAVAAAVTLAGLRLNGWLNERSWGGRRDADLQHVLDSASSLGSLKSAAAVALGQSWYLFVATLGLVVLGLVHTATHLRTLPPDALADGRNGPTAAPEPAGAGPAAAPQLPGRSGMGPRDAETVPPATPHPAESGLDGPPAAALQLAGSGLDGPPGLMPRLPGRGGIHSRFVAGLGGWAGREAVVGVFLLGSTVGLVVVAALFLVPPLRPDHVVYGRYLEIMAPPLLALGLVRLWTARPRRLTVELAAGSAVALVASVVATLQAGGLVSRGPVNWYTVLALPVLAQTREQIRPATATLVALGGVGILLVLGRRHRWWAVLVLAGALVAASVALRVVLVEARDRAIYGTQPSALATVPGLNAAGEVAYDLAASTPVGLYGYQWQLDRARFVLFDSRRDPVPHTRWVIAGVDWPQADQAGARRVWVHRAFGQALWRLPP